MPWSHSALCAVAVLLALPVGASAQGQTTDPSAESPAGAIYEIPLDSGRRDAAPLATTTDERSSTPAPAAGSGPGGGSSGTRSGSGGSSSGRTADPAPVAPRSTTTGTDGPSSIHSENGFGSSSRVPVPTRRVLASASAGDGGSSAPTYVLIALVAGVAVWVGSSLAASVRGSFPTGQ